MEEEPVIVPQAEAQPRRSEGEAGGGRDDDNGSNGSETSGVLVSPSSSPEPEKLASASPSPSSSSAPPPSYPLRGSVVAGKGLYRIDTHRAEDLTPELLKEIRAVHELCFPEERSSADDESDSDEEWLQRATFCHDPADCVWILLYKLEEKKNENETSSASPSASSSSSCSSFLASWLPFFSSRATTAAVSPSSKGEEEEEKKEAKKGDRLVGLVTGVPYSSSLFGFNLGVRPSLRRTGLGARLMHALQAAARARGLKAISATVEADKRGLVEYYKGHGGVVESAGVTSPSSAPPTVVRIVKRFDDEELARVTREADERILELAERSERRRRRRQGVVAAALSASVFAAVAALAFALLRGRQRRRVLK